MSDVINHEAVLGATEKALDTVEETIDGVADVVEVVRNNPVTLAFVAIASLSIGAASGYFVAKKRLKSFYEDLADEEIAQAKEFYARLNKIGDDGEVLSPMAVLEKSNPEAADALKGYGGDSENLEKALDEQDEAQIARIEERVRHEEVTRTINVFSDSTFDLEEEMRHRTPDQPYVISHDEFFENSDGHEQVSLIYYEKDDTLVDERDTPLTDPETSVGEDNLVRFGHGSKNKNVVYVRNVAEGLDYEITRSTGSYLEEVLGLPPEETNSLKHSDHRDRRRAFRHGDG